MTAASDGTDRHTDTHRERGGSEGRAKEEGSERRVELTIVSNSSNTAAAQPVASVTLSLISVDQWQ